MTNVHWLLKLIHLNGDHVKLNLLAMKHSSGQKHLRRKNEMPLLAPVHAQLRRVRSCAAGFDLDHNQQVCVRKCGQQINFQMSQAQISRDDVVALGLQMLGRRLLRIFSGVDAGGGFFSATLRGVRGGGAVGRAAPEFIRRERVCWLRRVMV